MKHTALDAVRTTLFREGARHVDVKVPASGWFATVRAWRGQRWPDLEKVWYGRLKPWIPWFSLERQALRAIEHVTRRSPTASDREAVRRNLRVALQKCDRDL